MVPKCWCFFPEKNKSRRVCSIMDARYNTHQVSSLNRSNSTAPPPPPSLHEVPTGSVILCEPGCKETSCSLNPPETVWHIVVYKLFNIFTFKSLSEQHFFVFSCLVFCATMIFDVISFYFLHFGKKKWGHQSNTKESQIKGSRVTWRMRGKQSIQATGPNTGNEQVPHVNTLTWWSEPCDPLTCCSAAACVDDWFQGGRGEFLISTFYNKKMHD